MISVEDSGWTIIPPQPFQDPHYDICQDLSRGSLHSNRSRHVLLWQELLTLKCAAKCPPKARVTIQTTLKINRQRKLTSKKQSKLNSKKILIMCAGSNAHRKYKKANMLRKNACMNAAILLQQKDATINNRINCDVMGDIFLTSVWMKLRNAGVNIKLDVYEKTILFCRCLGGMRERPEYGRSGWNWGMQGWIKRYMFMKNHFF